MSGAGCLNKICSGCIRYKSLFFTMYCETSSSVELIDGQLKCLDKRTGEPEESSLTYPYDLEDYR